MPVVGVIYLALIARSLLVVPGVPGEIMAGADALIGVVFLSLRLACAWPAVSAWVSAHAHGVAFAMCMLASTDLLAALLAQHLPAQGSGVMIYVLVSGALLQDRRYASVVAATCLSCWLLTASLHGFTGDWVLVTLMVVMSLAGAGLLNASRRRLAGRLVTVQAAIRRAALTDDLTGLVNRRGLLETSRALSDPRLLSLPVSVLVLDVDGLKQVNDSCGHADGDRLLIAAADALRGAARPGDVVARTGGDEFAVVLTGAAGAASDVRARALGALQQVGVSASIGVAEGTAGHGLEHLLRQADRSMYAVKRERRAVVPAAPCPERPATAAPAPSPAPAPDTTLASADLLLPADLRDMAVVSALLHLPMVPLHLLLLPTVPGRVLALITGTGMLACAGVALALRRSRWRSGLESRSAGLVGVLLAFVCAEAVAYVGLSRQMWTSAAVVLAIVGTGALLRSRSRSRVVTLATAIGWCAVIASGRVPGDWSVYALNVGVAVPVAALLNQTQQRTVDRLVRAQLKARTAAVTDELSGLLNRRGFEGAGRPLLDLARRRGGGDVTVLFLDLDGLKAVNDSRGHAAGDELIARTGAALRRWSDPDDVCARLGGDEFTVLMRVGDDVLVQRRVARLREVLAAAQVTASIGTARLGLDGTTLDELVHRADAHMYAVRSQRRSGRPERRTPPHQRTTSTLSVRGTSSPTTG